MPLAHSLIPELWHRVLDFDLHEKLMSRQASVTPMDTSFVLVSQEVDKGVLETIYFDSAYGELFKSREWSYPSRGHIWFKLVTDYRFGGSPRVSKWDIAKEVVGQLEPEDRTLEPYEETLLCEQIVIRLSDEHAHDYIEAHRENEANFHGEEYGRSRFYDRMIEIDEQLVENIGFYFTGDIDAVE